MKDTDLMIGDWVQIPEWSAKHNSGLVESIGWTLGDERCVMIQGNNFRIQVAFERIHGIPLTLEILAKNGLEKRCSDELVLFDNSKIDTTGEYFIIRYFVNTQRVWLCKVTGGYENEIRINCQYVHELQHALKLCGTDKEIVL